MVRSKLVEELPPGSVLMPMSAAASIRIRSAGRHSTSGADLGEEGRGAVSRGGVAEGGVADQEEARVGVVVAVRIVLDLLHRLGDGVEVLLPGGGWYGGRRGRGRSGAAGAAVPAAAARSRRIASSSRRISSWSRLSRSYSSRET